MLEVVQERVLGALRFLDSTTSEKVESALNVEAAGTVVRRNRSNLYVIWEGPASGTVTFTVTDPAGIYLSRKFNVTLPRDSDLSNKGQAGSIFQPFDVNLYPSSSAPTSPGWAVIRARVIKAGSSVVLGGALIRILRASDQVVLARGMSDARGEALVPVPGVPVTTFDSGNGAVMATQIDVTIQAFFDRALVGVPDPQDLEARMNALPSVAIANKLTAGEVLVKELDITIA